MNFYISVDKEWNTKFRKYRLGDEFLAFYFKYIQPNIRLIQSGGQTRLFEKVSGDSLDVWLGFAFERFCLKHSTHLAGIMGFKDDERSAVEKLMYTYQMRKSQSNKIVQKVIKKLA